MNQQKNETSLMPCSGKSGETTAIINVRVFDGREMSEAGGVLIKDGLIISMSPSQEAADHVVDGQGGTLLPGLIDAHVHVDRAAQLEAAARWGVTSLIDMGGALEKVQAALDGAPGMAQVPLAPGWAGAPANGVHARLLRVPTLDTVADAELMVADRVAAGAGFIKAIVDSPGENGMVFLDEAVLTALVKAAHEQGMQVVGHITTNHSLDLALRAGLDIMTHVPHGEVLTPELTARMRERNMKAIPTLYIAETMIAAMPQQVRVARGADYSKPARSLAAMRDAGIFIVAGTDSAEGVPGVPPGMPHGEALHRELKLLTDAGLLPAESLRAATSMAADLFGLKDRGILEVGRQADLLLVRGDPTQDINATRDILGVWIGGSRII